MSKNIFCVILLSFVAVLFSGCTIVGRNAAANSGESSRIEVAKAPAGASSASEEKSRSTDSIKKDDIADTKTVEKISDDAESEQNKIENRCGWYENPTPGNHWLTDKDGEWIIGMQGGFQAKGDYPPEFSDAQWVKTNISYGYGCACLRVKIDKKNKRITQVLGGNAKDLSVCRKDKTLTEPAG